MMIEPNPYLQQFYDNSMAMRERVLSDPTIISSVEEIIREDEWTTSMTSGSTGHYATAVEGELGVKTRELGPSNAIEEIALMADWYHPMSQMTPFVVPIRTPTARAFGDLVYLVKDFPGLPSLKPKLEWLQHPEIRRAVRHIISRGYGTMEEGFDLSDPAHIDAILKKGYTFEFLFDYDEVSGVWALVDYEAKTLDIPWDLVTDGATFGEGPFSRLNDIWKHIMKEIAIDTIKDGKPIDDWETYR